MTVRGPGNPVQVVNGTGFPGPHPVSGLKPLAGEFIDDFVRVLALSEAAVIAA